MSEFSRLSRAAGSASPNIEKIELALKCFFQEVRLPGLAFSMSTPHGDDYSVSFGVGAVNDAYPLEGSDRFRATCAGKYLVALSVLSLAESGLLDLNSEVSRYLPELLSASRTKAKLIKIKHLLSHSSGFRGLPENHTQLKAMTWNDCVAFFLETDLLFYPGLIFSEDHLNYVILGKLVERVTGRNVFEIISNRILTPLGCETALHPRDQSRVQGHRYSPAEEKMHQEPAYGAVGDLWAPAISNLLMLPRDIARIGLQLASTSSAGKHRIFTNQLIQQFREPVVTVPNTYGRKTDSWRVTGFGCGCATFYNEHQGVFATGMGQTVVGLMPSVFPFSLAFAFNVESPLVRNMLLDTIMSAIGTSSFTSSDLPRNSKPALTNFTAGFPFEMLRGRYVGPSNEAVIVTSTPIHLTISTPSFQVTVGSLQNGEIAFYSETRFPPLGFFVDPLRRPGIFIGMKAFGKVSNRSAAS